MKTLTKNLDECENPADFMKYARQMREITKAELSRRSGVDCCTIGLTESGRNPTISTVELLADGLGISIQEYVTGKPHKAFEPRTAVRSRAMKIARICAGMTLVELAERAGSHKGTIYEYESGRREPRLDLALRLAAALGISIDEYIGHEVSE